jgi:excisionase family DNA binding protein
LRGFFYGAKKMVSFDINEAAAFLKISASTLQRKAASGEIPAKKIGKRWVFIREHLADFISGRYTQAREGLSVIDGGLNSTRGATSWQSTSQKQAKAKTTTSTSLTQTASEYANLLGLKTSSKRKNFTTV